MSKQPEFFDNLIGKCGIFCGFCLVLRHEKYRCFGCEWANRMLRKSRESKKGCVYWECTQEKGLECCFTCEEFPCKTHYDSREAIFTKQILDSWKEIRRTGLTFWGRRKELESLLEEKENSK